MKTTLPRILRKLEQYEDGPPLGFRWAEFRAGEHEQALRRLRSKDSKAKVLWKFGHCMRDEALPIGHCEFVGEPDAIKRFIEIATDVRDSLGDDATTPQTVDTDRGASAPTIAAYFACRLVEIDPEHDETHHLEKGFSGELCCKIHRLPNVFRAAANFVAAKMETTEPPAQSATPAAPQFSRPFRYAMIAPILELAMRLPKTPRARLTKIWPEQRAKFIEARTDAVELAKQLRAARPQTQRTAALIAAILQADAALSGYSWPDSTLANFLGCLKDPIRRSDVEAARRAIIATQSDFAAWCNESVSSLPLPTTKDDPPETIALTENEKTFLATLTNEGQTAKEIAGKIARKGIPCSIGEAEISKMAKLPHLIARGVRHRKGAGYYVVKKTTPS